jgi:hypothetical protein
LVASAGIFKPIHRERVSIYYVMSINLYLTIRIEAE